MIPERIIGINGNGIITTSGFKIPIGNAVRKVGDTVYIDGQYAIMGQERYSSRVPYVPPQMKLDEFIPFYVYDANMNIFILKVMDKDGLTASKDEKYSADFSSEVFNFINSDIGIDGIFNNSKGDRFYIVDSNNNYAIANGKGDMQFLNTNIFDNVYSKNDTISFLGFSGDVLHKISGTKVGDFTHSTESIIIGKDLIKSYKEAVLNYLSSCNVAKNTSYQENETYLYNILFRSDDKDYFFGTASFSASGVVATDIRHSVSGSCSVKFIYDYTENQVIAAWKTKMLTNDGSQVERIYDDSHKDVSLKINDNATLILRDCILNNGVEVAKGDIIYKGKTTEVFPPVTKNTANGHPVSFVLPSTKIPKMLIHKDMLIIVENETARSPQLDLYNLLTGTNIGQYINKTVEMLNMGYAFVKK